MIASPFLLSSDVSMLVHSTRHRRLTSAKRVLSALLNNGPGCGQGHTATKCLMAPLCIRQVQGLLQLSRAMASLATLQRKATSAQDRLASNAGAGGGRDIGGSGGESGSSTGGGGGVLPQPLSAVEQVC